MNDDHVDTESMRRSRTREETLLALHRESQAHLSHLQALTGISGRLIRMALHGQLPYFRPDLSLLSRRLVVEIVKPRGRAYAITDLGRRRARQVLANRRREAARTLARGGAATPRVLEPASGEAPSAAADEPEMTRT